MSRMLFRRRSSGKLADHSSLRRCAVAVSLLVLPGIAGCSQNAANHSENCTKLMSQAVDAAQQVNYAHAEDLLHKAIEEASHADDLLRQPEAWTQLGDIQLKAKEPEKADASYRQALKLYEEIINAKSGDGLQRRAVAKSHAEALGKLGDALAREGRLKDAESEYKQALDEGKQALITFESQNDLSRRLAKVLTAMNKTTESAQLQSQLMANDGEKTSLSALQEGEALLDKGDEGAKVRFLSAVTMAKQHHEPRNASSALYFLAEMAVWEGDLAQARKYAEEGYQIAKTLPDNREQVCFGLSILGIVKQAQGDKQEGEKLIAEAAIINGGSCAGQFSSLATHFYTKHQYAQAAIYFRRAVDILDKYPTTWTRTDKTRGQWRAQNLEALANCYTQMQKDEDAHKAYVELLTENKFLSLDDRARYLELDAIEMAKLRNFPAAEKLLDEEMRILKSQNASRERIGAVFLYKANCCAGQHRMKDAESYLKQAIESAPPGIQQLMYERRLARIYMDDGKFEQASDLYEKLLPWKDKMGGHVRQTFLQEAAEALRKAHRDAKADEIEKLISEKPL